MKITVVVVCLIVGVCFLSCTCEKLNGSDSEDTERYTNSLKRNDGVCRLRCRGRRHIVCGSDLKTYTCELLYETCKNNTSIFVLSRGKCPGYFTECFGEHTCESGRKVCGTDGVTYPSACELSKSTCGSNVTVANKGSCDTLAHTNGGRRLNADESNDSSDEDDEENEGEGGEEEEEGERVGAGGNVPEPPLTPVPDLPLVTEVVGTTGILDGDRTVIQPTNLNIFPAITPRVNKVTAATETKQTEKITSAPQMNPHTTPCIVTCALEFSPVCGTDGKTYPNPCVLRAVACQDKNPDLKLSYGGECRGATVPPSEPLLTIKPERREGLPSDAECTRSCPIVYDPVCGIDGITYPSPCVIESMACIYKNPFLEILHKGMCETKSTQSSQIMIGRITMRESPCATLRCSSDTYDPVCGSDGNTYDSVCELDKEACSRDDPSLIDVRVNNCIPDIHLTISGEQYIILPYIP